VIGAGPIGCELAQCFQRFGSAVSLLTDGAEILPREDRDAAAIVRRNEDGSGEILSSVVRSQLGLHAAYGGVVPEIAARAHVELLDPAISQALAEAGMGLDAIDAVAAKMMGFDPMSIEYIRVAHEDGLGVGDPREIEIVGDEDAVAGRVEALFAAGGEFGIGMVGMRAMESMRIEKSYRMWGSDLTPEYTPFEAGLDRFVRMDKGEFIGRAALARQLAAGVPHLKHERPGRGRELHDVPPGVVVHQLESPGPRDRARRRTRKDHRLLPQARRRGRLRSRACAC